MQISCSECGRRYKVAESTIRGKRLLARCQCGASVLVEDPAGAPPSSSTASSLQRKERWFVNITSSEPLPMSLKSLVRAFEVGRIDPDTLVWRKGMPGWALLRDVKELSLRLVGEEATPATLESMPPPNSASSAPPPAPTPQAPGTDASAVGLDVVQRTVSLRLDERTATRTGLGAVRAENTDDVLPEPSRALNQVHPAGSPDNSQSALAPPEGQADEARGPATVRLADENGDRPKSETEEPLNLTPLSMSSSSEPAALSSQPAATSRRSVLLPPFKKPLLAAAVLGTLASLAIAALFDGAPSRDLLQSASLDREPQLPRAAEPAVAPPPGTRLIPSVLPKGGISRASSEKKPEPPKTVDPPPATPLKGRIPAQSPARNVLTPANSGSFPKPSKVTSLDSATPPSPAPFAAPVVRRSVVVSPATAKLPIPKDKPPRHRPTEPQTTENRRKPVPIAKPVPKAPARPARPPAAAPKALAKGKTVTPVTPLIQGDVPPAADSKAPRPFDLASAQRQAKKSAQRAANCTGTPGKGVVEVTIEPWGTVGSVRHRAQAFVGTPTGLCVMQAFQKIRTPAFDGEAQSFRATFSIP